METTNNVTERILEIFKVLKKTPLMILSNDKDYSLVQNYLEGYIDGLSIFLNRNMRAEITQWYKTKMAVDTSYYWSGHIPFHFKGKDEQELKDILINITEEFFKQNPDFYLSAK